MLSIQYPKISNLFIDYKCIILQMRGSDLKQEMYADKCQKYKQDMPMKQQYEEQYPQYKLNRCAYRQQSNIGKIIKNMPKNKIIKSKAVRDIERNKKISNSKQDQYMINELTMKNKNDNKNIQSVSTKAMKLKSFVKNTKFNEQINRNLNSLQQKIILSQQKISPTSKTQYHNKFLKSSQSQQLHPNCTHQNQISQNNQQVNSKNKKITTACSSTVGDPHQPIFLYEIKKLSINSADNYKYYIDKVIKQSKNPHSMSYAHLQTGINCFYYIYKNRVNIRHPSRKVCRSIADQIGCLDKFNKKYKKYLVIDLDETLIHSNNSIYQQYDFKIQFTINGIQKQRSIKVRPFAKQFLSKVSQVFCIIIFTASNPNYANAILEKLDPQRQFVSIRLFRQHCSIISNKIITKDLSILGIHLSQILIIDNSYQCFCLHPMNGIPIFPYYYGSDDNELYHLYDYLIQLSKQPRMIDKNNQIFKFSEYFKYYGDLNRLLQQLYQKTK